MQRIIQSRLALCAGLALAATSTRGGSTFSGEAAVVSEKSSQVEQSSDRSDALFGAKLEALSELTLMIRNDMDDGYDKDFVLAAERISTDFIRALPRDVALPEFAIDPDGEISLDWIASRHQQLSVSVGASHRLAIAWVDGSSSGYAVESFDGSTVPSTILDRIDKLMRYDKPAVRIA